MNFDSFLSDLLSTLIGGILLTYLFFLLREKYFVLPNINGTWSLETTTIVSEYNPYKNMILKYILMIYKEGERIYGTCEKIYENSSTGEHEYIGKDRKRGTITGSIEKKYFGKDKLLLHIVIDDFGRQSTFFVNLEDQGANEFTGIFQSMISNQSGTAIFKSNRL